MIIIKRNTNGDSRVATTVPTFWEFKDANESHIRDVEAMMKEFAGIISYKGRKHDWSKEAEPYQSMFYRELSSTIEGKMNFMDGKWAEFHYANERHHLLRNVPDDVNLFDVLEMIADCVCAGMARTGEVRPLEIDNSILVKAMNNTVDLAKSMIEVMNEDGAEWRKE